MREFIFWETSINFLRLLKEKYKYHNINKSTTYLFSNVLVSWFTKIHLFELVIVICKMQLFLWTVLFASSLCGGIISSMWFCYYLEYIVWLNVCSRNVYKLYNSLCFLFLFLFLRKTNFIQWWKTKLLVHQNVKIVHILNLAQIATSAKYMTTIDRRNRNYYHTKTLILTIFKPISSKHGLKRKKVVVFYLYMPSCIDET